MSKKPAKRWWPCLIRICVEFQKRGTSHSHFLAGPTFVPLWVSHKLKTNPNSFFLFFSLFSRRGKRRKNRFCTDFWGMSCAAAWKIPLFRAKKRKPLSFEVLGFGTAQHFHRWPSPFGMAMRGRCSPHSPVFVWWFPFRFQKSGPQSGDFFAFFWLWRSGFFHLSLSRRQILWKLGHWGFAARFFTMWTLC